MKNLIKEYDLIIFSGVLIIVGSVTLISSVSLFISFVNLVLFLMILISIKDLISIIIQKNQNKHDILIKFINSFIAILAYIFKEYSIAIVPLVFALYLLLNASMKLFSFTLLKTNKIKGGYSDLFQGSIYFVLGIILFFGPLINLKIMLNIVGIYSILLGISFLSDFLDMKRYRKFPKIKVFLPNIIEAFIPLKVLQNINKMISNEPENFEYIDKKSNKKPDLEILIHVTEDGFGILGHMDICFDDQIISFGNYDKKTYKFHDTTGSGVLFSVNNRDKYIKFCVEDSKKTMFVFGLKLNKSEKEEIRKNIDKIYTNLIPWNPPYKEAKRKNIFTKKNNYKDYASRLYSKTNAKFYKFKKGVFKIYFVVGNNCVSIANKIIGKALKNSFKLYGIMTPGTYYDYLEREFMKKDSAVISKMIYNKNNINKL